MESLRKSLEAVRKASYKLSGSDLGTRNKFLKKLGDDLVAEEEAIVAANDWDKEKAKEDSLDLPLQKRLDLSHDKLSTLRNGIDKLIRLEDPLNKTTFKRELDEGLVLSRLTCSIGVVCVIFESRPEAVIQISTLAIKSGNCVILKGGKEAEKSNSILVSLIQKNLESAGLDRNSVILVKSRDEISLLLKMDGLIDLFIPRGSNSLVKYIMQNTNIPVMGHADGICHIYVHSDADLEKAIKICIDSKTEYPAVCNACECFLIDASIADHFLSLLAPKLAQYNVTVHGDSRSCEILSNLSENGLQVKKLENPHTEYLTLDVSLVVVNDSVSAIEFINKNGSHHTDCMVSENEEAQNRFMREVDSAGVFFNCSTRFADGFRYGFGAEVGVSTNKLHARGPVGMEGLLTYKYKMVGNGHTVSDYNTGKKEYTHRDLSLED